MFRCLNIRNLFLFVPLGRKTCAVYCSTEHIFTNKSRNLNFGYGHVYNINYYDVFSFYKLYDCINI